MQPIRIGEFAVNRIADFEGPAFAPAEFFPDFDPEVGALLGCAVTTAMGVVNNDARLGIGESIAVFGAGGVGLNVVQFAAMVAAYPIIAIDLSGSYGIGWLSLIGPAMMYWLLVYASGIPPLEQHMLRSRSEAFRTYQARTSAFFPLPPRKN